MEELNLNDDGMEVINMMEDEPHVPVVISEDSEVIDLTELDLEDYAQEIDEPDNVKLSPLADDVIRERLHSCAECIICFDEKKEVVLLPCKHLCLCVSCSKFHHDIKECPLCRMDVTDMMQIYS